MDLCFLLSLLSVCSPVTLVMYSSKCSPSLEWSHSTGLSLSPGTKIHSCSGVSFCSLFLQFGFFFLIFNFNPNPRVYVSVYVHRYHSMNVNVKRQLPGVCQFFYFTLSSGDQTLRSSNKCCYLPSHLAIPDLEFDKYP